MLKLKWLLPSWLIVMLAITHPAIAQSQAGWQGVINTMFGQREPRPPGPGGKGGPRPADLCVVIPADVVWQTRPLFVWRGTSRAIGLRLAGTETVIWQGVATTTTNSLNQLEYTGEPLKPGKTYEWLFFSNQNSTAPKTWEQFKVIDGKERATITRELQSVMTQFGRRKATPEAIALQRTNYFVEKRLQADALQEIYSIKKPSVELQKIKRELEAKLCQMSG